MTGPRADIPGDANYGLTFKSPTYHGTTTRTKVLTEYGAVVGRRRCVDDGVGRGVGNGVADDVGRCADDGIGRSLRR